MSKGSDTKNFCLTFFPALVILAATVVDRNLARLKERAIIDRMDGAPRLVATLLFLLRDGKAGKDRVTMLPKSLKKPLKEHLRRVKAVHEKDLAEGGDAYRCPMRWTESIRALLVSAGGNEYFRKSIGGRTKRQVSKVGTMLMNL